MGPSEDQGSIGHDQDPIEPSDETASPARPTAEDAGLLHRIRARVSWLLDPSMEEGSTSRVIDAAVRFRERNRQVPATLLAGALASRLVIYLIPFIVLAVVATGLYSGVSGIDPVETARNAGLPGLLADAVGDSSEATRGFQTATLIGMAVAALWAANSLANLVRWIHALIWSVPMRPPRWRWTLPAAILLVSVGALVISRFGLETPGWSAYAAISEILLEFGLVTLGWLLVIRFLPRDPEARGWSTRLPGALLVAAGFIGLKAATIFYFAPRVTVLSERYGDVASAILLLTWTYWLAFIIVFSAELNAALFESRRGRQAPSDPSPSQSPYP